VEEKKKEKERLMAITVIHDISLSNAICLSSNPQKLENYLVLLKQK
jgi:hypothetical protein